MADAHIVLAQFFPLEDLDNTQIKQSWHAPNNKFSHLHISKRLILLIETRFIWFLHFLVEIQKKPIAFRKNV
jgi:hypothetical protein